MSIFQRIKCFLGAHGGTYKYVHDKDCSLQRHCPHCGKIHVKTQHMYGQGYYRKQGECIVDQTCTRCGTIKSYKSHSWGNERVRDSQNPCKLNYICTRCGERLPLGEDHDYGSWQRQSLNENWLERKCRRCNSVETRYSPPEPAPTKKTSSPVKANSVSAPVKQKQMVSCFSCGGTGRIETDVECGCIYSYNSRPGHTVAPCRICRGSGRVRSQASCSSCYGTGKIKI